mmetsp:Transcript_97872/g.169508  ORF Transcript_97872/g.169508 Transcript_97872/m.169508 type:complete len:295 (-) Transcript_97872:64-948(-)
MPASQQQPASEKTGGSAERGPTSTIFRSQFYRTRLCFFNSQGRCRYGTRCAFAHADMELAGMPDLTKTSLCKDWKEGKCTKTAAECVFAHGKHEIRLTPQYNQKHSKQKSQVKKAGDKSSLGVLISSFGAPDVTHDTVEKAAMQTGIEDSLDPVEARNGFNLASQQKIVGPLVSYSPPPIGVDVYNAKCQEIYASDKAFNEAFQMPYPDKDFIEVSDAVAPPPGLSLLEPMKVDLSFLDDSLAFPDQGNMADMNNFEEGRAVAPGLLFKPPSAIFAMQDPNKGCTLRLSGCLNL